MNYFIHDERDLSPAYVASCRKFLKEISHASGPQLSTIALDLKIMSNGWAKHGPRIVINGKELQAPSLRIQGTSNKLQAPSRKRHKLAVFM